MLKPLISARLDGKPVELNNLHNSISSVGFNHHGHRIFDVSESRSQTGWARFDLSPGNIVRAATYSETSAIVHQIYHKWTATNAGNWTGCAAQIANSILAGYSVMTATWSAISYANGNELELIIEWTLSGTEFITAGLQRIGHLCFDTANSYNVFRYISLRNLGVEQIRVLATYSEISDEVHRLSFSVASDYEVDEIRIYDAATGGQYCYSHSATMKFIAGVRTITITLSNPSSSVE